MTVLTRPRPALVNTALSLAHAWCSGHIIDGAPAYTHACAVATTLGRYALDDAAPELVAACLLHDAPEYAGSVLDDTARVLLNEEVLALIRRVEQAHQAMGAWRTDPGRTRAHLMQLTDDRPVLLALAADKIVALSTILRRAGSEADPRHYWRRRDAFLAHADYFRAFHIVAAPQLPQPMADQLGVLVGRVQGTAVEFR